MPNATKDAAGWQVAYTIDGAGEKTITFKTENKFVANRIFGLFKTLYDINEHSLNSYISKGRAKVVN